MSFLKKILQKINKSSSDNCFNLNKYAQNLGQDELGNNLTPLVTDYNATPSPPMTGPVIPDDSQAKMSEYISNNVGAYPMPPMENSWYESASLNDQFRRLAANILGERSEAFVSQAMDATERAIEAAQIEEAKKNDPNQSAVGEEGQYWDSLGGFDEDLATAYTESQSYQEDMTDIANSLVKNVEWFPQVKDTQTASIIAGEAVRVALSSPEQRGKPGVIDQRFNYFLSDVGSGNLPPEIAAEVAQSGGQQEKLEILKSKYGETLNATLSALIGVGDKSIKNWILKQTGNVGKDVIQKALGTSISGDERGTGLEQEDLEKKHVSRVEQRTEDIQEVEDQSDSLTKASLAFGKLYVQDIARDMEEVLSKATQISYLNNPGAKDRIERMQMYNKMILDQYIDVFNSPPFQDSKGNITFKNKNGQLSIPKDVLTKFFRNDIDNKSAKDLANNILENRNNPGADFDIMKWFGSALAEGNKKGTNASLMSHSALQQSYKNAYNIKQRLVDTESKYKSDAIAGNPTLAFDGLTGEVQRDKQGKKRYNNDGSVMTEGGMTSQEMLLAFDKLANADGQIPDEEKISRRTKYIDDTRQDYKKRQDYQSGITKKDDSTFSMYEKFAKMKMKGEDSNPINSMRPNAQYDVEYLMEGLHDVYSNKDNEYMKDIYKAFLGSLNPHEKVRNGKHKKMYKEMIGDESIDIEEDTSMLNDDYAAKFKKLEARKNKIKANIQKKRNIIETQTAKAAAKAKKYHARIQKSLDVFNQRKAEDGDLFGQQDLDEYVGVTGWDGKRALSKYDYVRIWAEKKIDLRGIFGALWASPGREYESSVIPPMTKIERAENAPMVPAKTKKGVAILDENGEPQGGDIRHQSLSVLQEWLPIAEQQIEKFKDDYGMNDAQYNMASALCQTYFTKIAQIDTLQKRYQSMKMASAVVDLDFLTLAIEKKFEKDFDNIFRM